MLAHRLDAAAEVDPARPDRCVEQLGQRGRERSPRLERPKDVLAGRGMDLLEEWHDLPADQAPCRRRVRRVEAVAEPAIAAERLGLLAPERQQRADDAVLAIGLDPFRVPARDEPVEDRLDLVARGVPGRTQAIGRQGVAKITQLGFPAPGPVHLDDRGAEVLPAEARILVGLRATQTVTHVQRGDAIPELVERVEEAARVGPAGDETEHLSTRLDQPVPANVQLDPFEHIHCLQSCNHQLGAATHPSSSPVARSSSAAANG